MTPFQSEPGENPTCKDLGVVESMYTNRIPYNMEKQPRYGMPDMPSAIIAATIGMDDDDIRRQADVKDVEAREVRKPGGYDPKDHPFKRSDITDRKWPGLP